MKLKFQDSNIFVYDFSIIFLPTDVTFENINKSSHELIKNAYNNNIIVCGPCGLLSILHTLKENKRIYKINEEYNVNLGLMKRIIMTCMDVINSMAKMGRSLESSFDEYNRIGRKFNTQEFQKAVHKLSILDNKIQLKNNNLLELYEVKKITKGETESIEENFENNLNLIK